MRRYQTVCTDTLKVYKQIYKERIFLNISPYLESRSPTAVNYLKALAALMDIQNLGNTM